MSGVVDMIARRCGAVLLFGMCASLWTTVAQTHTNSTSAASDGRGSFAIVGVVICLAALGYGLGLRRVWRRGTRGHREVMFRALAFAGGLSAVAVALLSPLDRWGAQLFALHMIQHETLMLIAAPLLVVGRPLPLFLWALSGRSRTWIANAVHVRAVQTVWKALLSPMVAWLLHALALWIWHAPLFFESALRHETVHDVQHLTFLASALVFWAAMVETRKYAQQGAAIIYLFTTTVHTGVLGALITFAARPWYAAYLQTPSDWDLSALEDQQLGGLIMWVLGSLVYFGIALALLVRWIRASDYTQIANGSSLIDGE